MFLFILFSIAILIIFVLMVYVGEGGYIKYYEDTINKIQDARDNALLNGNNLVNLPDLEIGTPNHSNNCSHGAIYLGKHVTNPIYCKRTCGSDGHIIQIDEHTTHFINGIKLSEGSWCVTHDPIECNPTTGYVIAGQNGVVCRSRFPEIIGGEKANKIEACNDSLINATNSVLMDKLHNEIVSMNTTITDVDEKLSDGSFRFVCEPGRDKHGNKYIVHPEARFHVIPDPCKESGAKMHDSVGVKYTSDGWECDCGDYNVTRVKNMTENPKSSCSSCYLNKQGDILNIPYQCATEDSAFDKLGKIPLCYPQKFISKGAECSQLQLEMVQVDDEMDMPFAKVKLNRAKMDQQVIQVRWPI